MFRSLLSMVFGCAHSRTTFPMTVSRPQGADDKAGRTYVACLDCGEELAYNWQKMQLEGRYRESSRTRPSVVSIAH